MAEVDIDDVLQHVHIWNQMINCQLCVARLAQLWSGYFLHVSHIPRTN